MIVVPVNDTASQTLNTQLGGQSVTLNIYARTTGLFMDVLVNNSLVVGGVICQNLNRLVRDVYLGFVGDLSWFDTQGVDDPVTPGLGTRFQLLYIEATDLGGRG